MSEQILLNLDMDGVTTGFDEGVDSRVQATFGLDKPAFRTNFQSWKNYPAKHREAIREFSNEKGFFYSLPVIDGAIEGIHRLVDAGYRPRILSSPIRSNPYSEREKLAWLEEYIAPSIGSFIVAEAVITSHKHEYGGTLLIDDRPGIEHADKASWKQVVFTQDYNRHLEDVPRVNDWFDPTIEETLRITRQRND